MTKQNINKMSLRTKALAFAGSILFGSVLNWAVLGKRTGDWSPNLLHQIDTLETIKKSVQEYNTAWKNLINLADRDYDGFLDTKEFQTMTERLGTSFGTSYNFNPSTYIGTTNTHIDTTGMYFIFRSMNNEPITLGRLEDAIKLYEEER